LVSLLLLTTVVVRRIEGVLPNDRAEVSRRTVRLPLPGVDAEVMRHSVDVGDDNYQATLSTRSHVRRQNIWDNLRRDRKEDLAHLLSDVMRPGRDGEDVDSEWSVV